MLTYKKCSYYIINYTNLALLNLHRVRFEEKKAVQVHFLLTRMTMSQRYETNIVQYGSGRFNKML